LNLIGTETESEVSDTNVGVELANEAGEVVVLEESREERVGEVEGIEDDEAVVGWAPRDEFIGGGIVNHVVGFYDKRCDHVVGVAEDVVLHHSIKKKEKEKKEENKKKMKKKKQGGMVCAKCERGCLSFTLSVTESGSERERERKRV